MTLARWYDKANSYSAAWSALYGSLPSKTNVALGLSVAEHETMAGDAWPGQHNWGAVQKRILSSAEKAVLAAAGITAAPSHVAAAIAALAAAAPPSPSEALHVDSSPRAGWYFVFFWAFPTDEAGAEKFVAVLAGQRASCKAILQSTSPSPEDLATAMYRSHYYEGIHDPHTPGGADANIADYAGALERHLTVITPALAAWTPGAATPVEPIDLCSPSGLQAALVALGETLTVDGSLGPLSRAAIMRFQTGAGLTADGKAGPKTRAALGAALGALGLPSMATCLTVL